jgi:hypothetical protein
MFRLSLLCASGLAAHLAAAPAFAASSWQLAEVVDARTVQPAARTARRVSMAADWDARAQTSLTIELAGGSVSATRSAFAQRRDGWTWQGRLDAAPSYTMSLTMHRGVLAGLIDSPEGRYEIVPLPTGGSALVELDAAAFPDCGGGLRPGALQRYPVRPAVDHAAPVAPGAAGEPIDVLVVYSPQVLEAMGSLANVEAQIQAAVDSANLSFANSDMSARFHLAGVRALPRDERDVFDLEWLRLDPVALAMRDEVGADLASLWVESSLTNCGAGFIMDRLDGSFAGDAVQITLRSCAVGNLVYAHEHGHNMGMQHDPLYGAPPAQALFPWAFGHYVDQHFTTIMSYPYACAGNCFRAPYFSNPDVSFMGIPTGLADQRDNHRVGNVTAPIIAGFRPRRGPIFADGFD